MLLDTLGRPLRNLRLSVTDRCNLRCQYCMPETDYVWLPRQDLLTFEEIDRVVDVFTGLGVDRVRITGGEPLLRTDVATLVRGLAAKPALRDLAMTTNGVLLAPLAEPLRAAGLHRLTVSLDTLDAERFVRLSRQRELDRVLRGMAAAGQHFPGFKIDTVVIRGTNDDEIVPLLEFARARGAEVRFIEYMDVGGATHWTAAQVVSRTEMLERVAAALGPVRALDEGGSAPADRFQLEDGTAFGIIEPFCRTCDRLRLTADGMIYLCLYATRGVDLRGPLRAGATDAELAAIITQAWTTRADRGAELRLQTRDRHALIPLTALKRDPHLEMHTRGG
jgi:cyclic pyranopterin phosphate synthase